MSSRPLSKALSGKRFNLGYEMYAETIDNRLPAGRGLFFASLHWTACDGDSKRSSDAAPAARSPGDRKQAWPERQCESQFFGQPTLTGSTPSMAMESLPSLIARPCQRSTDDPACNRPILRAKSSPDYMVIPVSAEVITPPPLLVIGEVQSGGNWQYPT